MAINIEQKFFKQKTVVEQVMEEIKSLIASGQFKVNDQIPSEMDLAERFGVSRSTIREALKVFNYLGVLNSMTGKGTYVSDRASISTEALTWALLLGTNELNDLIDLREIIEARGLIKLTENYSINSTDAVKKVGFLETQLQLMKNAIETNSKEGLDNSDFTFHLTIIEASGNEVFIAIYRTLQSFMLQQMHITHEDAGDPYMIVNDHQAILDGIKSKDSALAIDAFKKHMGSKCFSNVRKSANIVDN